MIKIREYEESDFMILREVRNDEELQKKLMTYPSHNTDEDIKQWIDKRRLEEDTLFFIVADRQTNQCIGFIQMINIDNRNRHGSLGIAIHRKYQGQGYGSQAITKLLDKLKKEYTIKKVFIYVLSNNYAAINTYSGLGFELCGILKKHFFQDNHWFNVLMMERLLDET